MRVSIRRGGVPKHAVAAAKIKRGEAEVRVPEDSMSEPTANALSATLTYISDKVRRWDIRNPKIATGVGSAMVAVFAVGIVVAPTTVKNLMIDLIPGASSTGPDHPKRPAAIVNDHDEDDGYPLPMPTPTPRPLTPHRKGRTPAHKTTGKPATSRPGQAAPHPISHPSNTTTPSDPAPSDTPSSVPTEHGRPPARGGHPPHGNGKGNGGKDRGQLIGAVVAIVSAITGTWR